MHAGKDTGALTCKLYANLIRLRLIFSLHPLAVLSFLYTLELLDVEAFTDTER